MKMVSEHKNPNKNLNPNWAQLLEKLKSSGANTQLTRNAKTIPVGSTLGKRKERSNEDSDASKSNPLIPTSSDCSLTDMLAMDCEMVGVSLMGNKSALGRVTVVNKWGNVVYDEYVRPVDYVVDFRTQISGIRPHDLRKAKNFIIVQKKVAELIKGRILVGHALRNDLKVLLLSHPKKDIRDTSEYTPFLKEGRSSSLKNLARQFLCVDIQNGEHCPPASMVHLFLAAKLHRNGDTSQSAPYWFRPEFEKLLKQVEDARAAMLLYQNHRKQWERSIKDFSRLKGKQKKRKYKKKLKTVES